MDAGPYYLGTGTEYFEHEAVKADFRHMVEAGKRLGCPVILGSSGMAGGNRNLDWMIGVAKEVFGELAVTNAKVAVIRSELDPKSSSRSFAREPCVQPAPAPSSARKHCARARSSGRWASIP